MCELVHIGLTIQRKRKKKKEFYIAIKSQMKSFLLQVNKDLTDFCSNLLFLLNEII